MSELVSKSGRGVDRILKILKEARQKTNLHIHLRDEGPHLIAGVLAKDATDEEWKSFNEETTTLQDLIFFIHNSLRRIFLRHAGKIVVREHLFKTVPISCELLTDQKNKLAEAINAAKRLRIFESNAEVFEDSLRNRQIENVDWSELGQEPKDLAVPIKLSSKA